MVKSRSRIACRSGAWLLACALVTGVVAQEPAPPDETASDDAPAEPRAQQPESGTPGMPGMRGTQGMQMTCCPPSAMSKMMDKPGGMGMMWVCMLVAASLIGSVIAVLIALTIFLIRRSRAPYAVAT